MAIEIITPGLASTIQDQGRPGYYEVGIPPSGAADLYSALAANLLVGNNDDAALIEATYTGPELHFTQPAVIAVTGATIPTKINGHHAPQWESLDVKTGDTLTFGYLEEGARIYIAISGGINVPTILGSRSTYTLGTIGGHQGRTLRPGDTLTTHPPTPTTRPGRTVPHHLRPTHTRNLTLRIITGLYDYRLTPTGLTTFLDTTWTLTPTADRVGYRYTGTTLEFTPRTQPFGAGSHPSNIVDAGYPIGSIQIPNGTEPIILHRDAVSGGGYATIATVISTDLNTLAQSPPGTHTHFHPITPQQAHHTRTTHTNKTNQLRTTLT